MSDFYITPCIGICTINPATQICSGCGRTTLEIRCWKEYTYDQRMAVMKRLGFGRRRSRINKNETANSQIGDEDGNSSNR